MPILLQALAVPEPEYGVDNDSMPLRYERLLFDGTGVLHTPARRDVRPHGAVHHLTLCQRTSPYLSPPVGWRSAASQRIYRIALGGLTEAEEDGPVAQVPVALADAPLPPTSPPKSPGSMSGSGSDVAVLVLSSLELHSAPPSPPYSLGS